MIGLNSGLLGVRRVPTTNSATGLWMPNEQVLAQRAGIWPSAPADPYWSSVRLLLQMQGTNGSTTFTDSSADARTVTAVGNAQISTARFKWGASSGLFDGNGDRISVTLAAPIGTDDFCCEGWFYISEFSGGGSNNAGIFCAGNASLASGMNLYVTPSGDLGFYGNPVNITGSGAPITTGAWHHIAATKAGSTVRLFANGTLQASNTYYSPTLVDNLIFGQSLYDGTYYDDLNGSIGAIRITVGQARYTSNFTPPATAFLYP